MNNHVVLSIDSTVKSDPSLIGLSKSDFKNKDWITIFEDADKFRDFINHVRYKCDIWVYSSDTIEAINLAATCKKDKKNWNIYLISTDLSSSLKKRASKASIDKVINLKNFRKIFGARSLNEASENPKHENVDSEVQNKEKINNKNVNYDKYWSNDNKSDEIKCDRNAVNSKNDKNEVKSDKINDANKLTSKNVITQQGKKGYVLSIFSASGGVGKSTCALTAAMLSQASGRSTLIIDADMQFGDIADLLDINNAKKIDELIVDKGAVMQLKPCNNLPCVVAPPVLPELAEKVLDHFPPILDSLSSMFDVVVVNTGSFWSELQAILLEKSNRVLFLIDQRPTSINATKKAINLCSRCGIPTGSILYAINRCTKLSLFNSVDVSCTLGGVNVIELADGGIEIDEYLASGKPKSLLKVRNEFVLSMWSVLEKLLPELKKQTSNKKDCELPFITEKNKPKKSLFSFNRSWK